MIIIRFIDSMHLWYWVGLSILTISTPFAIKAMEHEPIHYSEWILPSIVLIITITAIWRKVRK